MSLCQSLPDCAGCGQPACDHVCSPPGAPAPHSEHAHVLHARGIWCDDWQAPEGQSLGEFEPGGGSSGGGGASGSW